MPKIDISILIPLLTIIVSVVTSIIVTTLKNKSELRKIQTQLEQRYATSLFDKRLEVYPQLYKLLSNYGKLIDENESNVETLMELKESLDRWDSENSIYLTPPITKIAWRFRRYLRRLIRSSADQQVSIENLKDLRHILIQYEKTLRAEIGIFDSAPVGKIQDMENIYNFLDEKIHTLNS